MRQAPHITSYRFGRVVVDGRAHTNDIIILPGQVLTDWRRERGHYLQPDDLTAVLAAEPEVLVVGQGAVGRMELAPEVAMAMAEAGIELIVEWSGAACQTYNQMIEQRKTALALHLTC